MIQIYTLPNCPHCDDVKNYLNQHSIPYMEYDISRDVNRLDEMYKKTGQVGTPIIDVGGSIMVGFNQPRLIQILNQQGYLR